MMVPTEILIEMRESEEVLSGDPILACLTAGVDSFRGLLINSEAHQLCYQFADWVSR